MCNSFSVYDLKQFYILSSNELPFFQCVVFFGNDFFFYLFCFVSLSCFALFMLYIEHFVLSRSCIFYLSHFLFVLQIMVSIFLCSLCYRCLKINNTFSSLFALTTTTEPRSVQLYTGVCVCEC